MVGDGPFVPCPKGCNKVTLPAVHVRDGYVCQACGAVFQWRPGLEVRASSGAGRPGRPGDLAPGAAPASRSRDLF